LLLDSSTFRFLSLGWEDAMVGEKKANNGTTMVLAACAPCVVINNNKEGNNVPSTSPFSMVAAP